MAFKPISLTKDICVEKIFTIHYFEYMSDFNFPGERHDFWEFQYIDKGQVEVLTETSPHILNRGQIIFHKPNEFHSLRAVGKTAPNIIVVTFSCDSPAMEFFASQLLSLSEAERDLLGMLISEARHCIATPLDHPDTEVMEALPQSLVGSQQLVLNYLEQLLIHILRRYTATAFSLPIDQIALTTEAPTTYHNIVRYLEEHVRENLTVEQICHDNLIGRSQLHKMFRGQHHCGVIKFFSEMKISLAKELIRENQLNFTQISEFLGYSSIHYFSRQFKKITGMNPTDYSLSVKAKSERD